MRSQVLDRGYACFVVRRHGEVRSKPFPHPRGNKPKSGKSSEDSSSCVLLLGTSEIHLEKSSLQATHHNQQRNHCVVRLLAQGTVVALIAIGGWGMWNVGSDTLSSQSASLTAERYPIYVAGCPVHDPLEMSSARGGFGKCGGCNEEGSTHPFTSRQPGVRVGGRGHGVERQRNDRVPPQIPHAC
jgi:hypothetical protein